MEQHRVSARTRRSRALEMRGVPRLRSAISWAASAEQPMPSSSADRSMIRSSTS